MTERMSSVEIEDVLSSIRRLVSQDLRPKVSVVEDKLLLTPALRVVPQAAFEMAEDAMPQDLTEDAMPLEVAEDDVQQDLTQDATPQDLAEDAMLLEVAEDAMPQDVAEEIMPIFVHRAARHDLAGAVASIGAEVSTEGYEPETGESGPADAMAVPDWPDTSWVAPDVISDVDEAEVVALADHAPDWAQMDDVEEPGQADAEEAAFIEVDDDPTTYDPQGDAAEAAALADLESSDAGPVDAGLTELDEDMLRDIVRDIIREELHGALGERITRNVRKLVRAEINRATVARDLE